MALSMKIERRVIQLAGNKLGVEQIAAKLKISPQAVIKIGRRLGIRFRTNDKRNKRRTTKRT